MEKKKIAVLIGSLQATVASLLALLQLYGTLTTNISQDQRELHNLIKNLVAFQIFYRTFTAISSNIHVTRVTRIQYKSCILRVGLK